MSRRSEPPTAFDPLTLAAGTWLACGVVLYGLTPLPLHDATLGWSPAFWLLAAPCLLLVARRGFRTRADAQARHARSIPHLNAPAVHRRKTPAAPGRARRSRRRVAA